MGGRLFCYSKFVCPACNRLIIIWTHKYHVYCSFINIVVNYCIIHWVMWPESARRGVGRRSVAFSDFINPQTALSEDLFAKIRWLELKCWSWKFNVGKIIHFIIMDHRHWFQTYKSILMGFCHKFTSMTSLYVRRADHICISIYSWGVLNLCSKQKTAKKSSA